MGKHFSDMEMIQMIQEVGLEPANPITYSDFVRLMRKSSTPSRPVTPKRSSNGGGNASNKSGISMNQFL